MAKNSCLFPALYFNGVEGCVGQVYFLVGQALKTSEIPTIFILVLDNGDLKGRGVVVCGFKDWPSILIQILLTENQGCVVSIRHGYFMCLDWIRKNGREHCKL